jgi:glycosyltransferase involved in cell wall biosynthesis
MERPKISIITVTRNACRFIEETMQSVFAQTCGAVEYIVVDGASTDGTVDIIGRRSDRLATWLSEPDGGIYDAMNRGIALCRGDLIGIINAGDAYEPDAVERVVEAAFHNPEAGIFHGNVAMLNPDGSFFKLKKPNPDLSQLCRGMSLYHPTFFVRRRIYEKYGTFDTEFRLAADFDFALRCHLAGVKFHYIDHVISRFRKGGASSVGEREAKAECLRALLKNGFSEETVRAVGREQEWLRRKNLLFEKAYYGMKKIVPETTVRRIAEKVSVKG